MSAATPVANAAPTVFAETRRATAPGPSADRLDGAGEQSFSFSDFLSIINPLQHIPVVGTIYRAITGDTIKPAQKVIGGLLFGGPVGLLTSAVNAIVEQTTGKDIGEQALALVMPGRDSPSPDQESPEKTQQYAAAVAPPPANGDSDIAPLSRALLGADRPVDASSALAGGDRTGGPLFGRNGRPIGASARTASGTVGRTLADYRAAPGRASLVVDSQRTNPATAPVRLQTTAPLPGDHARVRSAAEPGAAPTPAAAASEGQTAGEPPVDPFVAAMMRGLDRYREMKTGKPSPAVIDATL